MMSGTYFIIKQEVVGQGHSVSESMTDPLEVNIDNSFKSLQRGERWYFVHNLTVSDTNVCLALPKRERIRGNGKVNKRYSFR